MAEALRLSHMLEVLEPGVEHPARCYTVQIQD